ncbi:hypothetical protein HY745_04625 [Candidatus Desantisbacteria bacterium]|nr:hypothetical protein [Candidatus Desantisbacteria bacterium]
MPEDKNNFLAQRDEIIKYQKYLSKKYNREVSRNEAAFEWISKFAAKWREECDRKSFK